MRFIDYYKEISSLNTAKKLIKGIITAPDVLIKSPDIGQEEESLKHRKIQYRYLVYKNYKLIYSVNENEGFIELADVFDTRQHPEKITRQK